MCSVSEWLSVSWRITAAVYCWISRGSMQAIGQKALGRIHLHTSMFQTQHFYCTIIFNWKHLVLSSWHSNHLYFIVYILRTKIGQPAGHIRGGYLSPVKEEGKGGRERERERNISKAFANVITGEIFELICTYLHFTGTKNVPTYEGPSKFPFVFPPVINIFKTIQLPKNMNTIRVNTSI